MAMGAGTGVMVGMTALAPVLALRTGAGYYPGIRNAGREPIHVCGYANTCDMGDSSSPKSWPAVMSRRGYTQD